MLKCIISQKCFYFCFILSVSLKTTLIRIRIRQNYFVDIFGKEIVFSTNKMFLCYTVLLEYCNFIMYIILLCSGSYSYPARRHFRHQNIITLDISFLFLSTEQTPDLATFIQMSLPTIYLNPHQV